MLCVTVFCDLQTVHSYRLYRRAEMQTAFHGPEMFSNFVYLYICFIFYVIIKVKHVSAFALEGLCEGSGMCAHCF